MITLRPVPEGPISSEPRSLATFEGTPGDAPYATHTSPLRGSIAMWRISAPFLFGVDPLDAATFAVTALVLAVVASIAMYRPAHRATHVQPMQSLRTE